MIFCEDGLQREYDDGGKTDQLGSPFQADARQIRNLLGDPHAAKDGEVHRLALSSLITNGEACASLCCSTICTYIE